MQTHAVDFVRAKDSWRCTPVLEKNIEIDHPKLKQPGITYFWLNDEEGDGDPQTFCSRPCCVTRLPEMIDAIVGPVAVILNPDRYQGDWWTTSAQECLKDKELRWYGADNFFMRHPVLMSLMLGSFRQAITLFSQGFDTAILRAVERKDVEDCLTGGDPKLALSLLKKLKPWLAVSNSVGHAPNFPFPNTYWHRTGQLQRAIHKYGYDELFGTNLTQGWGLSKDENENGANRYAVPNGPLVYFGSKKSTAAGKLLSKLGK
jgi:hypothetical protein